MRKIFSGLIGLYRVIISPFIGPSCRYTPTCSEYAQTAIMRFGIFKGGWISLKRIMSCHPWHEGGYDPVPETKTHCDCHGKNNKDLKKS